MGMGTFPLLFCMLLPPGYWTVPHGHFLLVADEEKVPDTQKDEGIQNVQIIQAAQRAFEQRRRYYGDIFENPIDDEDPDRDHGDQDGSMKDARSSGDNDSNLSTSTNSDSPYGSDSESSSSYDEYYAQRELPKKKLHPHHKGPIKLYFQELLGDWPMHRYKKFRRSYMKKHGIEINYGNVHTSDIKHSLKEEKAERKKEQQRAPTVTNMMAELARNSSFLFLDVQNPVKSNDSPQRLRRHSFSEQSKETMKKMKDSFKHSFKRRHKVKSNSNTDHELTTDIEEQKQGVSFY